MHNKTTWFHHLLKIQFSSNIISSVLENWKYLSSISFIFKMVEKRHILATKYYLKKEKKNIPLFGKGIKISNMAP